MWDDELPGEENEQQEQQEQQQALVPCVLCGGINGREGGADPAIAELFPNGYVCPACRGEQV
jgi:hypothetical protein